MKKIIIIALCVFGCTYKKVETTSISGISNSKKLKEVAREFLADIGGEEIQISSQVKGFYFNPKTFRQKELAAYKKWRPLFAHPRNCKLADMFQINYQSSSLLSLFSLPRTDSIKKESVIALCLPSFSLPFELDPKWILTYLSKGIHVVAINYEKEEKTLHSDWESACKSAKLGADWVKTHMDGRLFVLGKALGSIPASFVAANTPHASLILENALTLHPLTNKEWLKSVQGKILVIQPLGSDPLSYIPKSAFLMHVTGSHFGPYFGDLKPTWYETENDQIKLLKFLKG